VDGKAWLNSLMDDDLVAVRVRLREPDVVFVKGILEASEGLGAIFAEPSGSSDRRDGGAIVIAAPRSRAAELAEVIADLRTELAGAMWDDEPIAESKTVI
jgi:hypothetical protein